MKRIISTSDLLAREFDELQSGEQFIYVDSPFEFFAVKINNDYAALIDAWGTFILAQKYKNCLLIGSSFFHQFDTFAEVEEAAERRPVIF